MDVVRVVRVYSSPKNVGQDERAMILWLGGDLRQEVVDQVAGVSEMFVV